MKSYTIRETNPAGCHCDGRHKVCVLTSIKNFHHGVFLECLILYLSKYNLYFQIIFRLQKTLKMKKFELLGILVLAYCCDITKNSTFFHKCNSGFISIAKISYFWTFFFNSQALLKQKIVHFSPNCTFLPNLEHCTYREISIHHLVSFFFFVSRCLAWKIELFCGSFNGLSEPFNSKWLELVEENSQ